MSCGCSSSSCSAPNRGLKFFSGVTDSENEVSYLADQGANGSSVTDPNPYALAQRILVDSLAANLVFPAATGQSVTVSALKNGNAIASVTFADGESGQKRTVLSSPVSFSPGVDKLDVKVTLEGGGATQYHIAGTVGFRF